MHAHLLPPRHSQLGSRHLSGRWGERWDDGWAERRYRSLFLAMDLTRDFYFSYTYELSLTLQVRGGGMGEYMGASREGGGVPPAPLGVKKAAVVLAAVPPPTPSPKEYRITSSALADAPHRHLPLRPPFKENMSCGDQPAGGGSAPRAAGVPPVSGAPPMRDKFVWSHHLMLPLLPHLKDGAKGVATLIFHPPAPARGAHRGYSHAQYTHARTHMHARPEDTGVEV